jgi:hypothetical protein
MYSYIRYGEVLRRIELSRQPFVSSPSSDPEDDAVSHERQDRIAVLVARGMSLRAAENVIDAAMFGRGCIPEQYRKLQAPQ